MEQQGLNRVLADFGDTACAKSDQKLTDIAEEQTRKRLSGLPEAPEWLDNSDPWVVVELALLLSVVRRNAPAPHPEVLPPSMERLDPMLANVCAVVVLYLFPFSLMVNLVRALKNLMVIEISNMIIITQQDQAPKRHKAAAKQGSPQSPAAWRPDKPNRQNGIPITHCPPQDPTRFLHGCHCQNRASPAAAHAPMGFAIHPAPGRPNDNAHSCRGSEPSARTPPADSTRTSSISSLDGTSDSDDGSGSGQQPARAPGHTLEAPSRRHLSGRHGSRPARLFQKLRHALPVLTLTPRCGRLQVGSPGEITAASSSSSSIVGSRPVPHVMSFSGASGPCRRVTGTLYGHRKGHVALALQETPRCLPSLVVELALQTHAMLRDLGNPAGARIVLEAERRAASDASGEGGSWARRRSRAPLLLDEPAWTMFCNGKKTGYAVRREATDDDLTVMETLRAVSMGAGVLPGRPSSPADAAPWQGADDEVPYMRGSFDHFVGSRDSESLYMVAPQGGGTGPELTVFFVRL
ncbi:uncharacterized protein LOC133899431 [Phragmites australis]|uniref:uncharacterized protein LOC133899431 n=1 Tax=Phragmites australis TaxID=29695 RepID=UPI002D79144F|nr:uncharacterized protein LOC133899431 [Phragmites australis]